METYICAMCKGIFEKETPEEEAVDELHELFGPDVEVEDCDLVCDDCFEKIRPDKI